MAHAVLSHFTSSLPPSAPAVEIDSAGTGAYHEQPPPDPRTLTTLASHGIHNFDHAARKVAPTDFTRFDYVLAMDRDNLVDLRRKRSLGVRKGRPEGGARVMLFGDWDCDGGEGEEVEDPYYGGDHGFEDAFGQCVRFAKGWLREVVGVELEMDEKGTVKAELVGGKETDGEDS